MSQEPMITALQTSGSTQDLSEFPEIFMQQDALVFAWTGRFTPEVIKRSCSKGREHARSALVKLGASSIADLAAFMKIEVTEASWEAAAGRIAYLAESNIRSRQILLNTKMIDSVTVNLQKYSMPRPWGEREKTRDAVTAHEIYHIVSRRTSSPSAELEAHVFARELLGLPFSALLYEWALQGPVRSVAPVLQNAERRPKPFRHSTAR